MRSRWPHSRPTARPITIRAITIQAHIAHIAEISRPQREKRGVVGVCLWYPVHQLLLHVAHRPRAPGHSKLWGRNLARQLWQGVDPSTSRAHGTGAPMARLQRERQGAVRCACNTGTPYPSLPLHLARRPIAPGLFFDHPKPASLILIQSPRGGSALAYKISSGHCCCLWRHCHHHMLLPPPPPFSNVLLIHGFSFCPLYFRPDKSA